MRNIILFFLTITTLTVSGQNHFLGVKGGVNWTEVTTTNFNKIRKFRTGVAIGLTYEYAYNKYFSLGADIIYDQRGFINDIILTDTSGNPTGKRWPIKFNYDYVTVPLKVGFNYGKIFYGFANIGLTPSLLVDAKTIIPAILDNNGNMITGETYSNTSIVNKFNFGGIVEIGCGYKFKDRYLFYSSFSFQHSFTTITNSDYFPDSTIRHYGMTLNLGIKCLLKRVTTSNI